MAKIRDISNKKKKIKHGKAAKKGRTPIAKKGQGKLSKKKARKRLLEDGGGISQEESRESSKDRATKKKSAKKSKKKSKGKVKTASDPGGRDKRGRIRPGYTGNPKGGPKGALSLTGILREKLQQVPQGEKRTRAEMLIDKLIEKAIEDGNERLMKECLDRIEGKVPDRLIAAVGSGELQGMSEDLLLAAVGAIDGEKEQAPDSQKEEFMGPVQPAAETAEEETESVDLEGDQHG